MSRYPEVCLYFIPCISVHSFRVSSQTRASTGTTTTDSTHPYQRRIHMTNRTSTPKILSHIFKTTNHVLFQRDTTRPRIPIEPWATIVTLQRHTGNLPHQITTKHTPRPIILIFLKCCLHHPCRRLSFSSNTLLLRLARLTLLPTSASLSTFFEQCKLYNCVSTV